MQLILPLLVEGIVTFLLADRQGVDHRGIPVDSVSSLKIVRGFRNTGRWPGLRARDRGLVPLRCEGSSRQSFGRGIVSRVFNSTTVNKQKVF